VDFLRNLDIGTIAIQFAVLLFSLSLHEAAHAWTADRFGDYTARYLGRVTLNPVPHIDPIGTVLFPLLQFFINFPLIGWAKPVPINAAHLRNPRKDQIFISIAGPASNLMAGSIAFVILVLIKILWPNARGFVEVINATSGHISGTGSILVPILLILYWAMIINLLLAIFNLIPIPPLDGHWIVYGLLPSNAAAAFQRVGSYGFILLYALMVMGVFNYILIPVQSVRELLQSF
jgi:Zn-dependent protease